MTRDDSHYEPPAVEVVSTESGPAVTAAGDSPPTYGAVTLIEDDGSTRMKRRRRRLPRLFGRRKR